MGRSPVDRRAAVGGDLNIKAFKKGMSDDDKTAEKADPIKTIDANSQAAAPQPTDVNRKAV